MIWPESFFYLCTAHALYYFLSAVFTVVYHVSRWFVFYVHVFLITKKFCQVIRQLQYTKGVVRQRVTFFKCIRIICDIAVCNIRLTIILSKRLDFIRKVIFYLLVLVQSKISKYITIYYDLISWNFREYSLMTKNIEEVVVIN